MRDGADNAVRFNVIVEQSLAKVEYTRRIEQLQKVQMYNSLSSHSKLYHIADGV